MARERISSHEHHLPILSKDEESSGERPVYPSGPPSIEEKQAEHRAIRDAIKTFTDREKEEPRKIKPPPKKTERETLLKPLRRDVEDLEIDLDHIADQIEKMGGTIHRPWKKKGREQITWEVPKESVGTTIKENLIGLLKPRSQYHERYADLMKEFREKQRDYLKAREELKKILKKVR